MINKNLTALPQLPDTDSNKNRLRLKGETVHKGKILVVDDDADVVNAMQAYLTACGYMTVGCTSGKDAIEQLKTNDFDLILTDLMMPEMNGVELLRHAQVINPHLMGIIITGKGTIETVTEMMKEGAFLCSLKPFNFKMMQLILSCAIKSRQLKKLEEKYHILTSELANNSGGIQNYRGGSATRERDILELKKEIELIREELTCYEYLEKHWKQ